jgi:hypothetical protein
LKSAIKTALTGLAGARGIDLEATGRHATDRHALPGGSEWATIRLAQIKNT